MLPCSSEMCIHIHMSVILNDIGIQIRFFFKKADDIQSRKVQHIDLPYMKLQQTSFCFKGLQLTVYAFVRTILALGLTPQNAEILKYPSLISNRHTQLYFILPQPYQVKYTRTIISMETTHDMCCIPSISAAYTTSNTVVMCSTTV